MEKRLVEGRALQAGSLAVPRPRVGRPASPRRGARTSDAHRAGRGGSHPSLSGEVAPPRSTSPWRMLSGYGVGPAGPRFSLLSSALVKVAPYECLAGLSRNTREHAFSSSRWLRGPDVDVPGFWSTASWMHPSRSFSLWLAFSSEPPAALSLSRGSSPRGETARLRSAQGGGDGELPWHWRWRSAACRI